MATSIPSLLLPASLAPTKRKRSNSSLEILSLSPPYDTKRARLGIQELSTDPSPPISSLAPPAQPTPGDSPETQGSDSLISTEDDSESTSSSGSDSSGGAQIDEGYDSDSESGSTSTSSSSSSSDDSGNESTSRSVSIGMSSPVAARFSQSADADSLTSRLNTFLPTLAAANAQLDEERKKGILGARDIEGVNGGKYIEMNLGLGVLEEKTGQESDSETDGSDDCGNEGGDESDAVRKDIANTRDKKKRSLRGKKRRGKKREVIERLMGKGREGQTSKPSIEVVNDDG